MSCPVNIDSKGYGKIYKSVMRNRQLPLLAKAIYAYFCTYAGSGYQAYPKRDKIVRDLNINKDTYTKHLSNLIAEGYIAKERTAAGNVYTIIQTVPGYNSTEQAKDEMTDMLVMESIGAQGFGTVPKIVMLDARLSAQAKAIYAYFASFAGAGTTAFPRRATIMRDLNLHPAAYYSHFNLLLDFGYLSVEHRKCGGRFDVSLYRLSERVIQSPALHRKSDSKALSEKSIHDEKGNAISNLTDKGEVPAPMSEKAVHGAMLNTSNPMSEKPISENSMSEKTVCGNFGHANINNRSKTNNSFEKEHGENHQSYDPDDKATVSLFSLKQVKDLMRYEDLRCDALAWGELKAKLGHFSSPREKAKYMRKAIDILNEAAYQAWIMHNNAHDPKSIADILSSEDLAVFFDETLARWSEIRSVKGYVGVSLKNMLL